MSYLETGNLLIWPVLSRELAGEPASVGAQVIAQSIDSSSGAEEVRSVRSWDA